MSILKTFGTITLAVAAISLLALECGAQPATEYVIGPGDKLRVSVWRHPELDADVIVRTNGTVTIPPVGDVVAAGLRPSELSREIVARLRDYMRETTQVTVSVQQFNSRAVYVTGQVTRPGRYSFEQIPDLLQLLSQAGGSLPSADLSAVMIMRPAAGGPEVIKTDVSRYMRGESTDPLPQLIPGDTVEVPSLVGAGGLAGPGLAYIFGEVNTPGGYVTTDGMDLFHLIALAGGTTPEARLDHVAVIMDAGDGNHAVAAVDLEKVMDEGTADPFYIRAGDRVVITSSETSFGNVFLAGAGEVLSFTRDLMVIYLSYLTIEREIDDRDAREAARAAASASP